MLLSGFLQRFSLFELILLTFIAAAGIAVKPVVVSLSHLLTSPLLIPGGALAGGVYMLFIVLGGALVGKRGAATLICVIQCLVVMVSGVYGSHGTASIITYIVPGLLVDLLWLIMATNGAAMLPCFFGGMMANVSGTLLVNLVFFRLPMVPLLLSAALAAFSGGWGGIIAWEMIKRLKRLNVFTHLQPDS